MAARETGGHWGRRCFLLPAATGAREAERRTWDRGCAPLCEEAKTRPRVVWVARWSVLGGPATQQRQQRRGLSRGCAEPGELSSRCAALHWGCVAASRAAGCAVTAAVNAGRGHVRAGRVGGAMLCNGARGARGRGVGRMAANGLPAGYDRAAAQPAERGLAQGEPAAKAIRSAPEGTAGWRELGLDTRTRAKVSSRGAKVNQKKDRGQTRRRHVWHSTDQVLV